jgi:hypothetical protein
MPGYIGVHGSGSHHTVTLELRFLVPTFGTLLSIKDTEQPLYSEPPNDQATGARLGCHFSGERAYPRSLHMPHLQALRVIPVDFCFKWADTSIRPRSHAYLPSIPLNVLPHLPILSTTIRLQAPLVFQYSAHFDIDL